MEWRKEVGNDGECGTYELKRERTVLSGVAFEPDVCEVQERLLVLNVLHMDRKRRVVHERDGPKFGDCLQQLAPFHIHRREALVILAVWKTRCMSETSQYAKNNDDQN